jgi:hypothetical protein
MDRVATLTEQIRDWYEHSPTARRAYARFSADVSTLNGWARPKAQGLWERVAPLLDPNPQPSNEDKPGQPPGAPSV